MLTYNSQTSGVTLSWFFTLESIVKNIVFFQNSIKLASASFEMDGGIN